ncbi:unnamed protein product [Nippostrongylus brasiliensis]|uniref:Aa_trans domain-containing protein n=1 Tax=Nippostrongylus brasiliensis TaxID=27835 RepID=A0A0N4YY84_NIPBR|nr:unnamed protein product [Nippostrongylus brasiliensis]
MENRLKFSTGSIDLPVRRVDLPAADNLPQFLWLWSVPMALKCPVLPNVPNVPSTIRYHVLREPTMEEMFAPRIKERGSISPDQALVHMIKVMMGTGMLSLPLAFKHSGLWLGLVLLAFICMICIYCSRQLVFAQHYIGYLKSQPRLDYANVMRSAVELGPPWIRDRGYFWK